MYHLRIFASIALLCGTLCTPVFAFAQTTQGVETQEEIDAALKAAMNDPTVQEALKKATGWEKTATEAADAAKEAAAAAMESAKKLQKDYDKFIEEKTKEIMLSPEEIQKKTFSDYLDVKINPANPGSYEQVSISIESYLTDLQKAIIKWSVDGKTVSHGRGRQTFSFQNGGPGKTTFVSVSVSTNSGSVFTKDFSFTPVGITILWEANTYTPPFYKGKALMVPQAQIRVAAVPDTGSAISPFGTGNMVYTWEKNGLVHEGSSGFGKNVFSFTGPTPFNEIDVRVSVSSLDDSMNSEMRVFVPLARPLILFYEKHPLLGILYNKPLKGDFSLGKKEISLSAEPYFFSNEDSEYATLRYNWAVNGSTVQSYGRTLTLRNETGEKGDSLVSLSMRGLTKTSQSASQELKVHLDEEGSAGRPTF